MKWPVPRWYDLDRMERDEVLMRRLLGAVDRFLFPYHRAEVSGVEHVPAGPALYVGNHSGGVWTADTFLFCAAVMRRWGVDAVPYGLGHEVALMLPGANQLLVPLGAVRASHHNAHRLFAAGKKVMVYPGGDVDSFRPYRHRNQIVFGGRRGYLRLALTAGVPIVPVVSEGSQGSFIVLDDLRWLARLLRAPRWLRTEVWPAVLSVPWGLTIGPTPPYLGLPVKIRVEILQPIRFERAGPEAAADADYVRACADRVEAIMQETLTGMAAR